MRFKINESMLEVYAESKSRKVLVGTLKWSKDFDQFDFTYDKKYILSPTAIPIGPELPLARKHYVNKGKLFPSFQDRIPSKSNAAYAEYCAAAGISPKEKNPIVLLGAIGKRGPSAFVFEPIITDEVNAQEELRRFRAEHGISLHEIALALGLNAVTLQRISKGKSTDHNVLRLLKIYLTNSELLSDQLKLTGKRIHKNTAAALTTFAKDAEERHARQK